MDKLQQIALAGLAMRGKQKEFFRTKDRIKKSLILHDCFDLEKQFDDLLTGVSILFSNEDSKKEPFTDEQMQALKEFIGSVYLMRDAQKAFDVISSGKYLSHKLRFETQVDEVLKIFVTDEVRAKWEKIREEVTNG